MRRLWWLGCGLIIGMMSVSVWAFAQTQPCEAQLTEARQQILQLRKAKAQFEFEAASVGELLANLQKEFTDMKAKIATKPPESKEHK